jgi:hypothetical protein
MGDKISIENRNVTKAKKKKKNKVLKNQNLEDNHFKKKEKNKFPKRFGAQRIYVRIQNIFFKLILRNTSSD